MSLNGNITGGYIPKVDTTLALSGYYADAKATGDAIQKVIPKAISITLAASGWNSATKTQTVTVTGVLADETGQFITPTPSLSSQASYYDAGILCTGQASDSLTFTAETIPTENLAVYVTIQEVSV